jgi:16S rRNA (guanine527-N7)-methyltransferase
LRESLEPAAWIAKIGAERWLDFGSGAGLPAIPLAIAGLGSRWTLVESRRTKTLFLRKTISELALEEITVIYGRLEVLIATGELHARFEGFTSRATLTLAPTLALAAKIVVPGGYAFLWKGGRRDEEMQADAQWREYWELDDVMAVGDGRTAVVSFKRRR